jgi:ketosteroid isomerase-like protein
MSYRVRLLTIPVFVIAIGALALGAKPGGNSGSATQADSSAVAKVVEDFHNALSQGDSAKVLAILSDDAVILESGGVEGRAEYRSHHLREDIKFAKAVASKRGPLQIGIEGSSAWTVGTSTTKGTFNGKAIDSKGAESMVLTKQSDGWRIRSIHWSSRRQPASS